MFARIKKIEIAKSDDSQCKKCRNWIKRGDLRLVELSKLHYDEFYCMNCGREITDSLDKKRIELQLNMNQLT